MAGFTNTDNFVNPAYASPQQIAQQREYAKYLTENQMPITGGRTGWAQGLANVASALMGGVQARGADVAQRQGRQQDIASILGAMQPQGQPQTSMGGAPSVGPSATGAPGNAIAGIESGGKYDILGPVTRTGDRAYGKYQVMGNNIPEWSQAALGQPMTKEQFLASPQAQDAVFNHRFGQYTNKYGPEGAARAWFAGEGGMNDLGRKDQLGTSVGDYGNRFAAALGASPQQGAQQPPVQMAALGGVVPAQQPQAQPIPNAGATPPLMPAQQGGLNLPQGQPMGLNMPLIQALMGAQNLDPRMTQGLMGMAAPQMMEGPGGTYARHPITGQTQLVMPKVEKDTMEVGGNKIPLRSTFNPRTGQYDTAPILPGGQQQQQQAGQPQNPFGGAQPFIDQATANAAEKARQEKVGEEGGKAQMAPIAETMKEARTAPQAINALNIIEDTVKQNGDKITTGGAADAILKLKQTVNGLAGSEVMGDTKDAEIVKKMNAQLAAAALPAFTQRGTQFDLKVFMENNPGLNNSTKGTLVLTNILKQIHGQQLELSKLASDKNNWANWPQVQEKFYQDHPLMNPLTGKGLNVTASEPSNAQQQPAGMPSVGEVHNGYRFKGGNPKDQGSWEKAQ